MGSRQHLNSSVVGVPSADHVAISIVSVAKYKAIEFLTLFQLEHALIDAISTIAARYIKPIGKSVFFLRIVIGIPYSVRDNPQQLLWCCKWDGLVADYHSTIKINLEFIIDPKAILLLETESGQKIPICQITFSHDHCFY